MLHGPRRRRARHLALTLCAVAAACGGGPAGPVDGSRAMAHVEALVGIGPRPFGSDALAKAADYIEGQLKQLGLAPKRHEVLHQKEKKTIRNLYVQIDGDDPQNGPILMLGAHYDTKLADGHDHPDHNFRFVGAIDGGGAPGVLLELARVLQERQPKPKCNVWLYFIDAEESIDWTWNDDRALLGSQAFCEWLSKEKLLKRVKAFVLLDLIGSKAMKIDRDGNSDPRLQELFAKTAEQLGVRDRLYEFPTEQDMQWYRQKNLDWGTKDDHMSFSRYSVPSVLLIDFARRVPGENQLSDPRYERWWHTPDDDLDAMDADSLAFAGNLVVAALPALEAFVLGRK